MGQFLLLLAGAMVVGAIVFGVAVLITGDDPGLGSEEPDGGAVPLPTARPLIEQDIGSLRFDTALRGYRMSQVDAALRRAAYDLGYKDELIEVLGAELTALREGRVADADALRRSRESALGAGGDLGAADESGGTGSDAGADVRTAAALAGESVPGESVSGESVSSESVAGESVPSESVTGGSVAGPHPSGVR